MESFSRHSPDCKGPVSLPVVGVIKAAGFRMFLYKSDHFTALAPLDRKYTDHAVMLKNAENNDLTSSIPTTVALPVPAKRGLVAFHGPFKDNPEAQPVDRTTKTKNSSNRLSVASVNLPEFHTEVKLYRTPHLRHLYCPSASCQARL